MDDHQTVLRAKDAVLVLDNPAYRDAMDRLKTQIIEQWKDCPVRDQEGQLLLLQLAKLADKFDGILSGMIEAGKLAQKRIDVDAARNEGAVRRVLRRVG